ncbi:DinB family protein [soil metagenome]
MNLSDLTLDFAAVTSKQRSIPEQTAGITKSDITSLTKQLFDQLDLLSSGLTDEQVVFVALDPAENNAPGWNLAHILLHITASLEEGMALGSTLARGAEVTGRSRFEPDWETITTASQVSSRLSESRRMAFAFLETWPDASHLNNTYEHGFFGPMTAISHSFVGLYHGKAMLAQVEEIVRQAKAS